MVTAVEAAAFACLIWSAFVLVVQGIGVRAIFRFFSRQPPPSVSSKLGDDAPAVTIIRPVKGLEPRLYDCIASTFRQDYPIDKLSIRLCVDDRSDPAYPILQKLVDDFPAFDAQVLVESDDPAIKAPDSTLGPNPKIRNISRAYKEAKSDIVWMVDCNVWVATGVLGRMVDKLMGYKAGGSARPFKFVHHLPIVVDIVDYSGSRVDKKSLDVAPAFTELLAANAGGRVDEMFMGTTHAKFYGAINTVGIAPCIVGKSNMFRKSHLDQVTDRARNPLLTIDASDLTGVDHFSPHICEDHLIGDVLWRSDLPGYSNHGILWGDLVVQPMAGMSMTAFAARRVRWLRARKYTVLAATLVEPGVEAFLCCAYLAFAVTTLPWFHDKTGIPQTWEATGVTWLGAVTAWMLTDWLTFRRLHSGQATETDQHTPFFARGYGVRRAFVEWLPAWIARETMAIPIWTSGVLLGSTVNWRGNVFKVRFDMRVVEVESRRKEA